MEYCTNFGIYRMKTLCKMSIDKMCSRWYNGSFVPRRSGAERQAKKKKSMALSH
jgi:hypothetical protein